jgi:TonB family protein
MSGSAERAGLIGTLLAHGLLVGAVFVTVQRATEPTPLVYAVDLVAAPLPSNVSRRAPAEATPTTETEVAPSVKPPKVDPKKQPDPEPPKPINTPRDEKPLPVRSTNTPAPGETPSTGRDQITVKQAGFQHQYPGYISNIVEQVRVRWPQPTLARALKTEVAFTILKDGTVTGIEVVVRSGNYSFDAAAEAAIEAAGNARAFGPLPAGFPGGALPVTFFFTPKGPQ